MKYRQITLYFLLFTLGAYLLMVHPSTRIKGIAIVFPGLLYITSRYLFGLHYLRNSLEIVLVYLLLFNFYQLLGIESFIPFVHIITLVFLFIYFVLQRKYSRLKKIITAGLHPRNCGFFHICNDCCPNEGLVLILRNS
jgi:hypothetical protein